VQLPFPALTTKRLSGQEPFTQSGAHVKGMQVLAFWRWAVSNLADNTTRGLLAEYLVASALGVDHGVRSAWDAYDITSQSGVKIEVKCAAYVQAWGHAKLSSIRFSIAPSRAWDPIAGRSSEQIRRQADVYVLCLLKHQDKSTFDVLDLDQWDFYVLPTQTLDEQYPTRKTISLQSLRQLDAVPVPFGALREVIEGARQHTAGSTHP
jgi:hypothetical protein